MHRHIDRRQTPHRKTQVSTEPKNVLQSPQPTIYTFCYMVRVGGTIQAKEFVIIRLYVCHFDSFSHFSETFQPFNVNTACELKCEKLKRCQCCIWNMSITQALPSFIPACTKYSNISQPLENVKQLTFTAARPTFQEISSGITTPCLTLAIL